MKLDVFSEIQKRDCDANGGFARLLEESIEQARVADEAGFDCWWEVEHHCTPDFSYSSCPELILEAIAPQHETAAGRSRRRTGAVRDQSSVAGGGARRDARSHQRRPARSGAGEVGRQGVGDVRHLRAAGRGRPRRSNADAAARMVRQFVFVAEPALESGGANRAAETGATSASAVVAYVLEPAVVRTRRSARCRRARHDVVRAGRRARRHDQRLSRSASRSSASRRDASSTTASASSRSCTSRNRRVPRSTSGAPRSALWYVSSAPRVFNVPRDIFYTEHSRQYRPAIAPVVERAVGSG